MKTFFSYILWTILHPVKLTDELKSRNIGYLYGLAMLLFIGILYTITVIILYLNGFSAVMEPWIPISAEDYYFYEIFFSLPIFFFAAILFCGTIQLFSLFMGGKGSYEDGFAILSFMLTVPMLVFMWIPETIHSIFFENLGEAATGGVFGIPFWIDGVRQLIPMVWSFILCILAVKLIHRIHWVKSIVVTIIGFIPFVIFVLTYIR